MPTGIPAADLAQTGIGLAEGVVGLIKEGQLKKEANRLATSRPQYQISPLAGQDLSLAQNELASNSSAGEKAYNAINNGQFSSAIGAELRSGGTANDIGSIYGNNEDGRLKLAMMKDNLRLSRINNLARASQNYQQEQQTQWQLNKFAPWEDRAQAVAQARMGASQMVNQGFNAAGAGIMNGAQAIHEGKTLNLPTFNSATQDNFAMPTPIGSYVTNSPSAGGLVSTKMPTYHPTYMSVSEPSAGNLAPMNKFPTYTQP